ncbi:hypothetical protein GQ457_06G035300 [Hibiscus cannabinus]
MELQQPMVIERSEAAPKLKPANDHTNNSASASASTWSSHVSSNLCHGSESFRDLEMGVPKVNSVDKRLAWLRSQIIGGSHVEFDSPFGTRKLTYADHTASGRCLHYIENFIIANVLPFYGNSHSCDSYVGQRTTKMVHEASSYIKKCMGGGEDDAIMFCGSGTTAAIKRLQQVMGLTVPSIIRDKVINCLGGEGRDGWFSWALRAPLQLAVVAAEPGRSCGDWSERGRADRHGSIKTTARAVPTHQPASARFVFGLQQRDRDSIRYTGDC